eukprot:Platyproteum_vivax@DN4118_c0_g1_i1.p1
MSFLINSSKNSSNRTQVRGAAYPPPASPVAGSDLPSDSASNPTPKIHTSLKLERLKGCLAKATVDSNELRPLLWSGAPDDCDPYIRAQSWQMMLGYLPFHKDRQEASLSRKRQEYSQLIQEFYDKEQRSQSEGKILRQIQVDMPRTNANVRMFTHARVQSLMQRVLYIWAVRHPASGYVQGINDLLTPLVVVFLAPHMEPNALALDLCESLNNMPSKTLFEVEADCYWCLSKILSDVQDNYTCNQPGIQRMVTKLRDIVHRIDESLYTHLEEEGIDFMAVAFRWMNCFLMREMPLRCSIRLWDAYIAEQNGHGFSTFHIYLCAVFLLFWSPQMKRMDFQQLMLFVQGFPTSHWTSQEIETLLAEAWVLKSLFHQAPNHLVKN